MPRIKEYQTSFLVAEKGSTFIVPAPSLREGIRLLLNALKSTGQETIPTIVATMVKRSIFLNGGDRIIAQNKVSEKMIQKALKGV